MNFAFTLQHIQYILAIGAVVSAYFLFKGNTKLILLPELIPYSMHYKNVRAVLSPDEWQNIAKISYKHSKYQCDICKTKSRLECHEIWHFDDSRLVQKLVGLTSLCNDCHRVKHMGLAKKMGHYKTTIKHMAKVNKISVMKAERYVEYAETEVKKRKQEYALDLTYLNKYSSVLGRKFTAYENRSCQDITGNC